MMMYLLLTAELQHLQSLLAPLARVSHFLTPPSPRAENISGPT